MSVQIARNLKINGDLSAGEDLTVDCAFEGSIQLPGHHLTIAAQSQVHAAVSAQIVTVQAVLVVNARSQSRACWRTTLGHGRCLYCARREPGYAR